MKGLLGLIVGFMLASDGVTFICGFVTGIFLSGFSVILYHVLLTHAH